MVAVALAGGIRSSSAQVFSQNIVGYVNQTLGGNISSFATPLDVPGGNSVTNIFQNPYNAAAGGGPFDGDQVYIWNGHGFTIFTFDSTLSTGLGDAQDIDGIPQPVPIINPGTMIFFFNAYISITNTLVGTVHVDFPATGTQTVGTTTNLVPGNLQFVASKLPIAGGVSSVLGLTNAYNAAAGQGPLDGDQIYTPNISSEGALHGYNIVTFDSTLSTGFGDAGDIDGVAVPEPVIPVGQGFLLDNVYTTLTWKQSL